MTAGRNRGRHPLDLIAESVADRLERVERISRRLATGSYEVPAVDVADAVVAFFARNLELAAPLSLNQDEESDEPPANPGSSPHTC